jgi:K+ transporter
VAASTDSVFGIISLIFWAVTIIVTIKYVLLVLRADNNGEGGILALITLIRGRGTPGSRRAKAHPGRARHLRRLAVLRRQHDHVGHLGTVRGRGLKVVQPGLEHLIVPITATIILVLFSVQRLGTARIGRSFGPVMVLWFTAVGACGVYGIAKHPGVLKALSPTYAIGFVTATRERREGALRQFIDELHERPVRRVTGTAVFLNRGKATVPLAMRANVEHNHILHENVVILSIETLQIPYAAEDDRILIDDLGYGDDGIIHVTARFGYVESANVPDILRQAAEQSSELSVDLDDTSYFLSTIELRVGDESNMARWRKRLFVATSGITADAAEYFGLPRNQVVIMGSHINV